MQWLQKQEALAFGERYAASRGLSGAKIDALPRPVSPFNWTVFVSDDEVHHFAHINLVRDAPRPYQPGDGFVARLDAPYLPVARAQWARHSRYGETPEARALAREAFESAPLGFFRWFAALPAFDGITEGSTCAWFMDLRFQSPGRDTVPFRFGACRDAPGAPWRGYERDGETGRIPLD
jgi:inner membrane protein